jgi:hypothetical protein
MSPRLCRVTAVLGDLRETSESRVPPSGAQRRHRYRRGRAPACRAGAGTRLRRRVLKLPCRLEAFLQKHSPGVPEPGQEGDNHRRLRSESQAAVGQLGRADEARARHLSCRQALERRADFGACITSSPSQAIREGLLCCSSIQSAISSTSALARVRRHRSLPSGAGSPSSRPPTGYGSGTSFSRTPLCLVLNTPNPGIVLAAAASRKSTVPVPSKVSSSIIWLVERTLMMAEKF